MDVKDQGTDSISDLKKKLKVLDLNEASQFEEAYWYIKKHPDLFASVVVDTITQVQQLKVEEIYGGPGKKGKKAGGWGTLTDAQWGEVSQWMKTWITNYRDLAKELGIEVVFLAQERIFENDYEVEEDDDGNPLDEDFSITPEISPALMPSVAKHLNAQVQVIGSTFIRRSPVYSKSKTGIKQRLRKKLTGYRYEYCLRIGPNHVYMTKVRKPKGVKLPPSMVDPTYKDLCSIIQGD